VEHTLRNFENRELGTLLRPQSEEVTAEWIRLHNKELYDLHFSPRIIRIIRSCRMSWEDHVAHRGWVEVHTGFWWRNLMEIDHIQDLAVDGIIIRKFDLQEV
jgi:hypothetical protein